MAHKVCDGQQVRILTVQIAVPMDADLGEVADEISAHLSENGTCDPSSRILDWRYLDPVDGYGVVAPRDYEEGEIFSILSTRLQINEPAAIKTEDGYVFIRQNDGSYVAGGDLVFSSWSELLQNIGVDWVAI